MEKYLPYFIAFFWVFSISVLTFFLSSLVRPKKSQPASRLAYNSGEMNKSKPWIKISARYQSLIAIAAVFFIGILILYPVATTFRSSIEKGFGGKVLIEVIVFFSTLMVGLAYGWIKGDLSWVRESEKERHNNGNA